MKEILINITNEIDLFSKIYHKNIKINIDYS